MADVVAEQGLVQVMRELLADPDGGAQLARHPAGGVPPAAHRPGVPGTLARPLRSADAATRERLERQSRGGALRDDVPVAVLAQYLELVLEGLISHLAMGLPADDLGPVLDVVEASVRRSPSHTT